MKKSILFLLALLSVTMTTQAVDYYYKGNQTGWSATAPMSVSSDGYYAYAEAKSYADNGNQNNHFKIALTADSWDYGADYLHGGFNGTDIENMGSWDSDGNCCIYHETSYYVLAYFPNTKINTTNKVKICASTFLPDDSETDLPEPEPVADVTVHFINSVEWAEVACHHWVEEGSGTSWPGDVLSKTDEIAGYDIYTATFTGEHTSCIFNNNNNGKQTDDLTVEDGKYYDWKTTAWYADKAAAEAALATPIVKTYTVVGSSAPLFGSAWATDATANDMTLVEGTKYELVKNDITLAAGEIQYKVAVNHAWTEAYPSDNAKLSITEAGKYKITFTFDSETTEVGATAELIEAAVVLPTVGVKGAWDGWATTTTLTGDDTSAAAIVNIATAGIYKFGLDVDGNFQASGATIDKANNSTVVTTNAGDMKLTANVLGDYTFTWTYETNTLTVTYPAGEEVEITKKYYIAGTQNLTGFDWQADGLEIAKEGDVYKHTFNALAAGTYEFKITDGQWNTAEDKTHEWGYSNLGAVYEEVSEGTDGDGNPNGNIKFVTGEAKNITVIFDATAGKITFENLTEITEGLTYTVKTPLGTENCYIASDRTTWNFRQMEPTDEDYVFTITIVGAQETDEYKYACQANWDYCEVREADEDGNSNRKAWTALDEVGEWCNPTYQLKGVGGWATEGIELVQNPKKPKEYMLTCQSIAETDAVKVVKVVNGAIPEGGYYGSVKDGVAVTVNYDDNGNIKLPAGTYDFYFDTETGQLWIQEATDCETEPEVETIKVYDAVATNDYGELTIMGETSDGKDVMVAVYGFDENVANSTLEAMFIIGSWEESPWSGIEETATRDDLVEQITLSVTVEGTVVTVTGTFTSENNITYDLTISGIIQATPQAEPIHYDIDDADCIFAEDKLQISSESTGVTAFVNVGEELLSGTYDAEIISSDIYAMGACTLVVDGEKITFTFEGSGWDAWDNEVPVTANISGTLLDTNGGIPMTVTNLFTSEDTQEKTLTLEGSTSYMGDNYEFRLILENYDGGYGEYALVTSAEEGEGSQLGYPFRNIMTRYANASGSMTKSYDNELGTDVYKGTISATTATGEEYVIDLTMYYIEPEAIDVIIPDANITIDSDNKLTMTGSWNSYTVSVELADFSAEAEYAEALIFVEPEYGMLYCGTPNKPIITVNDNTVTLQGLFVNMWDSEALHNVSISGTLPVEEPTPDYTRPVTSGNYGTICLPFGGTITGAVLYECVGSEPGKVYLGSVTTLAAGVPYIFQATATELAAYSDGTTATEAGSRYGLHGTFVDETVVAAGNYILLGNTLRPSDGEAKVNANRAYLVMSEVPVGAPQQMPGRRYIGMSVQGENGATGVEDIFSTDAPVKAIENGQLIIIRDGVKYNVQGQKL